MGPRFFTHAARRALSPASIPGLTGMRRCLTLLELLITVALIVTMAALALPAVLGGLAERSFLSATEGACDQILMARAHAQTTGRALEIDYYPDPPRIVVSAVGAMDEGEEAHDGVSGRAGDDAAGPLAESADLVDPDDASKAQAQRVNEPWATRLIGEGVRIQDRAPARADVDGQPTKITIPPGDEAISTDPVGRADGTTLRLAVLMPDGSAVLQRTVWIVDDDGRAAKLTINPWTGVPQVERVTAAGRQPTQTVPRTPAAAVTRAQRPGEKRVEDRRGGDS